MGRGVSSVQEGGSPGGTLSAVYADSLTSGCGEKRRKGQSRETHGLKLSGLWLEIVGVVA